MTAAAAFFVLFMASFISFPVIRWGFSVVWYVFTQLQVKCLKRAEKLMIVKAIKKL